MNASYDFMQRAMWLVITVSVVSILWNLSHIM